MFLRLATTLAGGKISEALPTFQWVAPEVLSGRSYDVAADMYSYGMVLFEILRRQIPFSEFDQFFTSSVEANGEPTMLWKEMAIRDAIHAGLKPSADSIRNELLKRIMLSCWDEPSGRLSSQMAAHMIATANPSWKIAGVVTPNKARSHSRVLSKVS